MPDTIKIRKANELVEGDPTILDHLGDVFDAMGKPEQAVDYWKQSYIADPENKAVAEKLKSRGIDFKPLRKEAKKQAKAQKRKADGDKEETKPEKE